MRRFCWYGLACCCALYVIIWFMTPPTAHLSDKLIFSGVVVLCTLFFLLGLYETRKRVAMKIYVIVDYSSPFGNKFACPELVRYLYFENEAIAQFTAKRLSTSYRVLALQFCDGKESIVS